MKTSIKMSTILLTSGIILSTLLTACDSAETTDKIAAAATETAVDKMTDSQMDVSIDNDNDKQEQTIVMKGEGDEEMTIVVGSNVALPEGFPSDVPLPASMKLISATELPDEGYTIHGAVAGDISVMIEHTKKEAKDAGWQELMTSNQDEVTMIMLKKEDRIVNYSIMELDPKDRQVESHNLMYSVIAS